MPTVKQLVGLAIAITVAIVGAGAVGIAAVEHSATQGRTNRATPAKADFRLNDHQRLRKMLLGQKGIELPLR
jgi:Zn-dependent alcohol dehydrogenase